MKRRSGSGSVGRVSDEAMAAGTDRDADTDGPGGSDASRTGHEPLDLDRVERDLAGVEDALARLDDGTYWTDEVTGQPIPHEVLAADPVARRAG